MLRELPEAVAPFRLFAAENPGLIRPRAESRGTFQQKPASDSDAGRIRGEIKPVASSPSRLVQSEMPENVFRGGICANTPRAKMCTILRHIKIIHYICQKKQNMVVVSSREFRANQRKYFDLALSNDVVIKSRSHGSYRLVPVTDDDTIIDSQALQAKITRGIAEYEQGKAIAMAEGESIEGYLNRLIAE